MPKQLLESNFLTADLSAMFRAQEAEVPAISAQASSDDLSSRHEKNLKQVTDWGLELKKRLRANRNLKPDSRKSDYDVESKFFDDYFNNAHKEWDAACAKQLRLMGEPLKKALKVLGFNKNTNPILSFILDRYVITELVKTRLLNINTFKAIYNAVAKNLVADSEFSVSNDYNIIYCKDLYRKPVKEMMRYLQVQSYKECLPAANHDYSLKQQEKNKKVFFNIEHATIKAVDPAERAKEINNLPANIELPSATDPHTKLNSTVLAEKVAGKELDIEAESNGRASRKATKSINSIAEKLETPAQCFAALQYFSMTTKVKEAKQALKHDRFIKLSTKQIAEATAYITPLIAKNTLPDVEVKQLVVAILDKLEQS
jgi:hypothetical protein